MLVQDHHGAQTPRWGPGRPSGLPIDHPTARGRGGPGPGLEVGPDPVAAQAGRPATAWSRPTDGVTTRASARAAAAASTNRYWIVGRGHPDQRSRPARSRLVDRPAGSMRTGGNGHSAEDRGPGWPPFLRRRGRAQHRGLAGRPSGGPPSGLRSTTSGRRGPTEEILGHRPQRHARPAASTSSSVTQAADPAAVELDPDQGADLDPVGPSGRDQVVELLGQTRHVTAAPGPPGLRARSPGPCDRAGSGPPGSGTGAGSGSSSSNRRPGSNSEIRDPAVT